MRRRIVMVLCTVLLAAGCEDRPTAVAPRAPVLSASATDEDRLAELARGVALALGDAGLRQRVKNDLRDSRSTREHKLHLGSYLRGNGGILLAKMAQQTGRSREDLLALLRTVPELEFYMPVPEHRASWRGGDNLLVAAGLREEDAPRGYDLRGRPVQLSAEAAPATPTLVLVPIETDFSETLDTRYKNTQDDGGNTIGTFAIACATCIAPDEKVGISIPAPQGLYMTADYIEDEGEGWTKGAPEIEVHTFTTAPDGKRIRTCAGEKASGYRRFNQDSHSFSGSALLLTPEEAVNYGVAEGEDGERASFIVWENDYTACKVETDRDLMKDLGSFILGSFLIGYFVDCPASGPDPVTNFGLCATGVGIIIAQPQFEGAIANLIYTNDDLIGYGTARSSVPNPEYGSNYTHMLLIPHELSGNTWHVSNGAMTVQLK